MALGVEPPHLGLPQVLLSAVAIMGPRVRIVGKALALTIGLGSIALNQSFGGGTPSGAPPFCPPAPFVSRMPRGSVIDSLWVRLGPGFGMCRVKGSSRLWAAQCVWFGIEGIPNQLFLRSQMDSLEGCGAIGPSTITTARSYRYPVRAERESIAAELALRRLPSRAPKAVREQIEATLRAHARSFSGGSNQK